MIVRLDAPMAGWAMSLDDVPDPVFAERMMGDGLAIDPLDGVVRAPCDATVVAVAPTRHSVTLRLANGAELLIHVGLDTVALGGEGFVAKVAEGDAVASGQALLEVALDPVAARAKSLVTPIILVSEGYAIVAQPLGRQVGSGDAIADVAPTGEAEQAADLGEDTARCQIRVPLANGIHARPAARIVAAVKSLMADVSIEVRGKAVNARSMVGLLSAGIVSGDEIEIAARGPDARPAVAAIARLIESGMGEEAAHAVAAPVAAREADGRFILGTRAAPGLAIGPVFRLRPAEVAVREQGAGVAVEAAALAAARTTFVSDGATAQGAAIAAAHQALVDDPELVAAAQRLIAQGKSAAFAWRAATRDQAAAIRATGNALLIERIADLTDVERRLTQHLTGQEAATPQPPAGVIVITDELLPSQFAALSHAGVAGICTAFGGPTAHASILAAAAGIPMLVAAGPAVLDLADGAVVVLDADDATLDPAPDVAARAAAETRQDEARARAAAQAAAAHDDCVMADGSRIEIFANLASVDDATQAVALGAEGCGLLRTEFLFHDRAAAPDEEEQRAAYAAIAAALNGRPLIVRTLDVGGDKPIAYLPFPPEDNPALGARGIRFSLAQPDLLATQLRAILRGVPHDQCRIMLPMVVDPGELAVARTMLDAVSTELGVAPVPLGVMVETPAAALLAGELARDADFLSIGSNDLTQYALAADRGNPAVAAMVDALHPAVLQLIAAAGAGAARHNRWLGVCGGIASDPAAAPLLIGLGVTELSASAAAVPALKAVVRQLDLPACRALAERALACATTAEVRDMLKGAG